MRRALGLPPVIVALCVSIASGPANGNDRPFQVARTAVRDDDGDRTWSIESWVQRYGSVRGVSVEPEYDFGGGRSVQFELGRLVDHDGMETGHEGEVEFKQLFNRIDKDGWAWGISAAAGVEHSRSEGAQRHLNLKLPLSIAIGAKTYVHLNPGIDLTSGARRVFAPSVAVEHRVFDRTIAFVELARERELRFGQIGMRHWIKREHVALDLALQQRRLDGHRQAGFILGLGFYEF